MSILKKSNSKVSSRQQIKIDGVRNGILLLPKRQHRLVLESSSINFELVSEDEQDALIDTYQNFLNSLNTGFQIFVRIREMDMDKYLENFKSRMNEKDEKVYKTQADNYMEFISGLVSNNKILTRKFYIILPYKADTNDFNVAYEQLKLQADIVAKGLGRLGMQVRKLNSIEILDLFYSFYSPGQAKRAPLRNQTIQLLKEAYL